MKIKPLKLTYVSEHTFLEYRCCPNKYDLAVKLNEVIEEINRINKILTPVNKRMITMKTRQKILALHKEGMSYRAIAAITGVGFSSVGRILKKMSAR